MKENEERWQDKNRKKMKLKREKERHGEFLTRRP